MERQKSDREVKALLKIPGVHRVGSGLYLRVRPTGAAYWIYRYMKAGRSHELSLGPIYTKSLAEARAEASAMKVAKYNGADPIFDRKKRLGIPTFKEVATSYIETHKAGWRNHKHAAQWTSTLSAYAYPTIGTTTVDQIDTTHILSILKPIWVEKTETAMRVRQRVEAILDFSTAHGDRQGDNPARWKGHLDHLLPAPNRVQVKSHFASLPWAEMGSFMKSLQEMEGVSARALEFVILTVARSGEVRGMPWSEVDLKSGLWIVPAGRMKAKREHRIPLSKQAIRLLRNLPRVPGSDLVFNGARPGQPLSDMSLTAVLRRMKRDDLTVHGFRSSFRDWAAETTDYPREVAEAALAHTIESKVEAAYRRGDLLTKRKKMMQDWANFCFSP